MCGGSLLPCFSASLWSVESCSESIFGWIYGLSYDSKTNAFLSCFEGEGLSSCFRECSWKYGMLLNGKKTSVHRMTFNWPQACILSRNSLLAYVESHLELMRKYLQIKIVFLTVLLEVYYRMNDINLFLCTFTKRSDLC